MLCFSVRWERVLSPARSRSGWIQIRATVLDEHGRQHQFTKTYQEWIGVCTSDIDRVVARIQQHFPNHEVSYERLGLTKKILPYFEERLSSGKLDYCQKPFYKVFTSASHQDVGRFFNCYKIGYCDKADWLVRLYIDLCNRYDSHAFYYKWYDIQKDVPQLLESFIMKPERTETPDWTIAAFDIETVPMDGSLDRVPCGTDPTDTIVMISVCKWNQRRGASNYLLYLVPTDDVQEPPRPKEYVAYHSEDKMLNDFHYLISDCQVLTGYNVNGFDLPCIFSRLFWLNMWNVLNDYSSSQIGESVVTTYKNKIVLDLYHYFKTFSGYDLPSFKLDAVARIKLKNQVKKIPVKSTGIWTWYTAPKDAIRSVYTDDVERCHRVLNPTHVPLKEFGTFATYLDYCLRDSELVRILFEQEDVLSFLVERANFTACDAASVLYWGNSRFLLELFKAYGTRLGFFFNPHFFKNPVDETKYLAGSKTYQGALNFCIAEQAYEDVSVMDFTSMYPSALLSSNLCYGTCTILDREKWLDARTKYPELTSIPYRVHGDNDFLKDGFGASEHFQYPAPAENDDFVIVVNRNAEAFLPCIVSHFIELRKLHQKQFKETRNVYHKNVQLCIKILINSLYGVMANKDSGLSYTVIAMSIVTLSRYQLLGSYHFVRRLGFEPCYADTDSLMVHHWPDDNCDPVNRYLNLPHVELKYEQRMKKLLVLSKKRYVYETADGQLVTKGFQKKINAIVGYMSKRIVDSVWNAIFSGSKDSSLGWVTWVETLLEVEYMCRDATRHSIYRKTRALEEYKSNSCAVVRFLKKYPEKANDYVEFTYSRADVSVKEASSWIMDAHECHWVDVEKLYIGQKKIFVLLMNLAFWNSPSAAEQCDMVLNTMRWKKFVMAELLYFHANGGRRLVLAVQRGIKFTFRINDHLTRPSCKRKSVVDRPAKKPKQR